MNIDSMDIRETDTQYVIRNMEYRRKKRIKKTRGMYIPGRKENAMQRAAEG